jgi:hypothetical protein
MPQCRRALSTDAIRNCPIVRKNLGGIFLPQANDLFCSEPMDAQLATGLAVLKFCLRRRSAFICRWNGPSTLSSVLYVPAPWFGRPLTFPQPAPSRGAASPTCHGNIQIWPGSFSISNILCTASMVTNGFIVDSIHPTELESYTELRTTKTCRVST